ncbi:adenylate kinase [Lactiplantibacillus modestisalitolerans]|uniref:Adenylate kinase n=1 Tax=Lactiplantibacillus modestisalitolerans TaxID=1457219 RepID=A0ABV5WRY5_9LACO|nr:adenylate kinase [Lactiplantibacillus modestisalitolerans]
MKKVVVIGSPGAGKSTFARKLQLKTGLPLVYLDLIWHQRDRTTISRAKFEQRLQKIINGETWIIDGNYCRTLPLRLNNCDTVFLLDYPVDVCLQGAKSRVGLKRVDLPWVETEFDPSFQQYILDFPYKRLPLIYDDLARFGTGKAVTIFKARAEANAYLDQLD